MDSVRSVIFFQDSFNWMFIHSPKSSWDLLSSGLGKRFKWMRHVLVLEVFLSRWQRYTSEPLKDTKFIQELKGQSVYIWHGFVNRMWWGHRDDAPRSGTVTDRARQTQDRLPAKPKVQQSSHPNNPGTYLVSPDVRCLEREKCENPLLPSRWRGKEF